MLCFLCLLSVGETCMINDWHVYSRNMKRKLRSNTVTIVTNLQWMLCIMLSFCHKFFFCDWNSAFFGSLIFVCAVFLFFSLFFWVQHLILLECLLFVLFRPEQLNASFKIYQHLVNDTFCALHFAAGQTTIETKWKSSSHVTFLWFFLSFSNCFEHHFKL